MIQSARAAALRSTALSICLSLFLSVSLAMTTGIPVLAETAPDAPKSDVAKSKAAKLQADKKADKKPEAVKKPQAAKTEAVKTQAIKPETAKSQTAKSETDKKQPGAAKVSKSEVSSSKTHSEAHSAGESYSKSKPAKTADKSEGKSSGKSESKSEAKKTGKNGAPLAIAPAGIQAASRAHATLPPAPARKPTIPAAVAATSSTSQADTDAVENVIDLVRKHKPDEATAAEAAMSDPVARKLAEWIILRSDDNGASVERYRAFISANPSWPSQSVPAPAPAKRRCGTTTATMRPWCGRGSRTNLRCRPRAAFRWRGR